MMNRGVQKRVKGKFASVVDASDRRDGRQGVMLQQLIGGIIQFIIFCAVVAQLVNWVRTTFFPPGPEMKDVRSEQPAMLRRQPKPQGQRISSDPTSFLPEMTQQGVARPAAMTAGSRRSKTPDSARGQQSRPRKQKSGPTARPSANPVGVDRSPGSGVGAHVDTFIGQHVKSHIGNQLADSVKTDISDQVRSHLGEDRNKPPAPTAATTHGSAAAGDLLLALRSPQGVRQAILISEVLSKPKALRRS